MPDHFADIAQRISVFIGGAASENFETLALELYALQRQHNPAYAKLCDLRGIAKVTRWQDIPAVSTFAFKELEMTSLAPPDRARVFYSSGTTQQDRSRHFHSEASLALYELSLWHHFHQHLDIVAQPFVLTPRSQTSSLAHMFEILALPHPESRIFGVDQNNAWSLDLANLVPALQSARNPIALLGTAFQFVQLLDALPSPIQLPHASWILETGGYKGRSREIPKTELHQLLSQKLGLPSNAIYSEYGMSELSSQAYDCAKGQFQFPHWARLQIISPATGRPAAAGEPGLLRVYDLANVWSVMAIQTEDLATAVGNKFQLLGRAPASESRGCSLMSV